MGKNTKLIIAVAVVIVALAIVFSVRSCNNPVTNY